MLLCRAQSIAKEGESDVIKINIDWINRFKKRHAIVSSRQIGEAGSVTPKMTSNWLNITLPKLREAYADDDIYNLMKQVFFGACCQSILYILKERNVMGAKE